MRVIILICGYLLLVASLPLASANQSTITGLDDNTASAFDYASAVAFSQAAIGNRVDDFRLINAAGKPIRFSYFRGKPLVLSMVYTSCYQVCPMTTRHLSKIVEKARETLGESSFSVAIVGFDTNFDTPVAMQYFANKQGISDKNWTLLSISETDVEALSKQIGFQYFPSSNGFDHLIQATIIDAEGVFYGQVYGQVFDTPLLIDPLMELVLGRAPPARTLLSEISRKVRLFCTTYDPVRDGYFFDYSLFLGIFIGGSIIAFTGFVMVREFRKN